MVQTKQFLDRIKLLSGNYNKSDWKHFSITSEELQVGIINKQLYGLYKAAIGRTYVPKVAQLVVDILTGLYVCQIGGVKKIFVELKNEFESLLVEEKKLSPIQKFFKEYKSDSAYIINFYFSPQNVAAPYLAILALAGKEDADLMSVFTQFAGVLRTSNVTRNAQECLQFSENREYTKCKFVGLMYLRSLVNHYAIVATMKHLSEVTQEMKSSEIQDLLEQCNKYGVSNKLGEVINYEASYLIEILEEIEDIFLDYPQGKVRKEGMKMFKKYTAKYFG